MLNSKTIAYVPIAAAPQSPCGWPDSADPVIGRHCANCPHTDFKRECQHFNSPEDLRDRLRGSGWAMLGTGNLQTLFGQAPEPAADEGASCSPTPPAGEQGEAQRIEMALLKFILGHRLHLWRLRRYYVLHVTGAKVCPVMLMEH